MFVVLRVIVVLIHGFCLSAYASQLDGLLGKRIEAMIRLRGQYCTHRI